MFRLISWAVSSLLIAGLILALLTAFNWNLVALGEWIVGITTSTVRAIADWLLGWSWFQKLVSS